ncbi:FAD-dependent monooxygenase, partial [Streptomyces hainanensis]
MRRLRTQVGIVGAGPAGLVLANALTAAGVDCEVVERGTRQRVESRSRAGFLEHRTVAHLRAAGLADRLLAEGVPHGRCEFQCLGRLVHVDYSHHSGGYRHWAYPQHELVRDLIAALVATGRPPHFGRPAYGVEDGPGAAIRIVCAGLEIHCDQVVGCDGRRGVAAHRLTADAGTAVRESRHRHPYDWLAVLADVDRQPTAIRYAVTADGFAGMMPRAGTRCRFYLQCPPGDTAAYWPHHRIRARLRARLATEAAPIPDIGAIHETQVVPMRCRVTEPLRHGVIALAGDAAHLLTPSGAKGLNLAVADAADLAAALVAHHRDGDDRALDGYTARRLPDVRRTRAFSDRLLRLLHLPPGDPAFALRRRLAAIHRLAEPGPRAADFAHRYAGSGTTRPALAPAGP